MANAELVRLGRKARKGAPNTFDSHGYATLLKRLRDPDKQQMVYAPAFHRKFDESVAGEIAIRPEVPLVITEGNYLLLDEGPWRLIRAQLDEIWFVDVDDQQRQAQLLERHMRYGLSHEEALAWIEQTDEPNARRIAITAERADFRIVSLPRLA